VVTAAEQPMTNFEGHTPRDCGEHRTVGAHRAWCHDCREWCYPGAGCQGCELPGLRTELTVLRRAVAEVVRSCHSRIVYTHSGQPAVTVATILTAVASAADQPPTPPTRPPE
jgi:hypothetical protein